MKTLNQPFGPAALWPGLLLAGGLFWTASATPLSVDDLREVVQRSVPYLEAGATDWVEDRGCVSCHQMSSLIWNFTRGDEAGLMLDRDKLAERQTWSRQWESWVDPKNKNGEAHTYAGNVDTMAQLLLGRPYDAGPAEPWILNLRDQLLKQQKEDGGWNAQGQVPLQKRPQEEGRQTCSMWVLLALKSVQGTPTDYSKALGWLAKASPGTSTEWWALKTMMGAEFGTPEDVASARAELLKRQNVDGGWGWLTGEASDALGTGYALYALGRTGGKLGDAAIQKACAFLKSTQTEHGFWAVPSTRGRDNNKVRETASFWGTAWAGIALLELLDVPASG